MRAAFLLLPALTLATLTACDLGSVLRKAADVVDGGGDGDGSTSGSSTPAGPAPTVGSVGEVKPQQGFFRSAGNGLPQPEAPITHADCSTLTSGGPTDGCLTGEIRCGETIVGHTVGGTRAFDTRFYVNNYCTPDTTDHDSGDERVYRLHMPEGEWRAVVTLDTPCADLDVAAMTWSHDQCPGPDASVNRCEMFPKKGTKREQLELVSQKETTWLLVVEGKDAEEGAFGLSVQCFPGLH